ncbi:MAG: isochorismate synthase [Actinomycetota bacterium]|nr:isochorismate synthase [Actinomycetota bacterium]
MSTPLVAHTTAVDDDFDLLALSGHDGLLLERSGAGLAGRGVATRVAVSAADELLAAIECSGDGNDLPGRGAVAFGALPFNPSPSSELVVPSVVWGRDEHGSWVTTIGPAGAPTPSIEELLRPAAAAPGALPQRVIVEPVRPAAWWRDLVAEATRAMAAAGPDGLAKVVLARELLVEADTAFDRAVVLHRLRRSFPGCFLFHVEGFLGASPELLVGRAGEIVRAQPMAGTAPRGGDPADDARLGAALLASSTYRHEHQVTIDMVYDTLVPWCSYLDYEAEPSVVGVANVQHLATLVEGRLSQPTPSVLELVRALHPTPAVSGWPRELANEWIAEHEGFDRGRYAGTVGWVDGHGNGTWAVSIRCAEVEGPRARIFAGNGIVATSDPDTELAETQAKLLAVLGALTRV